MLHSVTESILTDVITFILITIFNLNIMIIMNCMYLKTMYTDSNKCYYKVS